MTKTQGPPVVRRSAGAGQPRPTGPKIPAWVDWLILLIVIGVLVGAIWSLWQAGTFGGALSADQRLSWHLVRASGFTAFLLLTASTLWGIFLATRVIKDYTPGPASLLLHVTASWLAVILSLIHAGLLLFDNYYTYTLSDLVIPFTGPYRPLYVGLGTLSAWLLILISISFNVRKWMGQRAWRILHFFSYFTFVMVAFHALLSGADADKMGVRVILIGFGIAVVGLFVWRIKQIFWNADSSRSIRAR